MRVGVPVFLIDLYQPDQQYEGYKYTEETDKKVIQKMAEKGEEMLNESLKER
jgi:uncharacterized protein (UPF0254 family)